MATEPTNGGYNRDIKEIAATVYGPLADGVHNVHRVTSSASSTSDSWPAELRGCFVDFAPIDCTVQFLHFTGSSSALTYNGTAGAGSNVGTIGVTIPLSGSRSIYVSKFATTFSYVCSNAGGFVEFFKSSANPGER
jgi:hypothetical protein